MKASQVVSPSHMRPSTSLYHARESSSRLPPSALDRNASSHPRLPLPPPGIRSAEKLRRQRKNDRGRESGDTSFRKIADSASELGVAFNVDLEGIQSLHEEANKSTEKTRDFLRRFGLERRDSRGSREFYIHKSSPLCLS